MDAAHAAAAAPAALTALAAELDAIVTSLRTMPAGRLAARLPGPIPTRADAGRLLARVLAVAAQGIEQADDGGSPRWREVPRLPDLAVGDQVKVLAYDLAQALAGNPSGEVWAPDGRVPLSDVLHDVSATAKEVRRLM
ncbi:MAG TPA: hypothetical protein VF218_07500 [Acidothermaceae bacterium]